MRKILFTSVCVLALTTGAAFAQGMRSQPAPGASGEGEVGPGTTTTHSMKKGTTTGANTTTHKGSHMANPTSHGNVGPGTKNDARPQPGGR